MIIMGIITRDIGIDLGTSTVKIYIKGKGIVLNEPSVVAINNLTGEILCVGKQAKEMLGRTPDNIITIKPIREGVIADFNVTRNMLNMFIDKVLPKSFFRKLRLVISIPYGITDVEERAVEGVAYKTGAKDVFLIEEVMAAAIGSSINIAKAEGSMIVNIGSGTTEIAVMSLGGMVICNSIKTAGNVFDRDIVDYVKDKFNVLIAENDAEEVKKQIGCAYTMLTDEKMSIKGRSLKTGLPETVYLTTKNIKEAINTSLLKIVKAMRETLEKTPPELSADIMQNGIIISGGCANIKNIDKFFSEEINVPIRLAEDFENTVIKGIGATLENIAVLKKAVKTRR